LLCSLLHSLVTSSHIGPNILLSTLFSNIFSLCVFSVWETKCPTHAKQQEEI
jgi:hypothetical protein